MSIKCCQLNTSRKNVRSIVIIGAIKCGTTSLYRYLVEHPHILPASTKEIDFFDRRFHRGVDWYRKQFTYKAITGKMADKYKISPEIKSYIAGEATPAYLFHPLAPKRVFQVAPKTKLIVLLRNPVNRAFSHYNMWLIKGEEHLSFAEAIACEKERIQPYLDSLDKGENINPKQYIYYSYLSRGIYVEQLERWMAIFPREQFLILRSEDFFANPDSILQKVLRFLGLPGYSLSEYDNKVKGDYPPMDNALRKSLAEYYQPYNQKLEQYLGMQFNWEQLY